MSCTEIMAHGLLEKAVSPREAGRWGEDMVPGMLDAKGTKILAKSLFRELRGNGYSANQILSLSTELIDLVTQDLKAASDGQEAPVARQAGASDEGWRAAL
jgi:hypothetical protein